MRFELDENLGARTAELIAGAGHDVETVSQESLSGTSDAHLFETCIREQRCIISLDLDFADVLCCSPSNAAGIVVLRLSRSAACALYRPCSRCRCKSSRPQYYGVSLQVFFRRP